MAGMDGEDKAPRVALVAGATRGAGRAIAVELARAGFHVYATGRSSRTAGRSEIGRPETIEETGELMTAAGGRGTALVVDHEDPTAVAALAARIESGHGRLDVLVNDIFGGDHYAQWDTPMWEHDLAGGLRMLRMGVDTHIITAHATLPLLLRGDRGLLVEMTDGTAEVNASYREQVGFFYDLVKANVSRIVLCAHRRAARPAGDGARRHARAGSARRACSTTSGSPRRPGATRCQGAAVRDLGVTRPTSPAGSPPSPRTRTWPSSPARC